MNRIFKEKKFVTERFLIFRGNSEKYQCIL